MKGHLSIVNPGSIHLSNGLKKIGSNVFRNSMNLKSMHFGTGLEFLEEGVLEGFAFCGTDGLFQLSVSAEDLGDTISKANHPRLSGRHLQAPGFETPMHPCRIGPGCIIPSCYRMFSRYIRSVLDNPCFFVPSLLKNLFKNHVLPRFISIHSNEWGLRKK